MSRLEIRTDESRIDWLWSVLQVSSTVPLLSTDLVGHPFEEMGLFVRNNGGNVEFTAAYKPAMQLEDNKPFIPSQFMSRYMRTHLKRPDETLSPNAQEIERDGKLIVVEPAFKISDGIVYLPRDSQHPDEIAFSIQTNEGNIIITQGNEGTQNIPLTSRADLEGRIGQLQGLLASYTTSVWDTMGRGKNELTLEWQFPNIIQPQTLVQAREKYLGSPEIIGRKHRTRDFALEWDNVGGLSRPRRLLEGAIVDIENPTLSQQAGTNPYGEKIFLVTGDGETGKTSLVRATATELQKRVASRGGLTFYYFDCASGIQEYGTFIGTALNSVIKAAQDDVITGRTAFVHIDNLASLYAVSMATDPELTRGEMIQVAQRVRGVRDAVRNAYDFHTKNVAAHLEELQGYRKRVGQLRYYQHKITDEEMIELVKLEERAKLQGTLLSESERERYTELRYWKSGLSRKEKGELAKLAEELDHPYLPTLVVVAESELPRSHLGTLSDVMRREVKVYNEREDRADIFRALIGAAEYTLKRARNPMVKFDGIDYNQLAVETDGMSAGSIKELHLDVMNYTKLQIHDTGQPHTITTSAYLDNIRGKRDYMAKAGELKRSIGFIRT